MKRLSILLPVMNLLVFAIVALVFMRAHGGWVGDVTSDSIGTDTISEPADVGSAFFNRWNFSGNRESLLTRGFLYVNVAAFDIARLLLTLLGVFWDEFKGPYPVGLSYASYSLVVAIPFSILQWFVIGLLVDRFRRRPVG